MNRRAGGRRDATLLWGLTVEIYLVGVLLMWRLGPSAVAHGPVASRLLAGVLVMELLLTAVAMVAVVVSSRLARRVRHSAAMLASLGAGSVAILAITPSLIPRRDGGASLLLALAAIGMGVLVGYLRRVPAPADHRAQHSR